MKHKKLRLIIGGAMWALALFAFSSKSDAATSITLDLHVSINATKSLTATSTTYNYGALSVNVSSVSSAFPISNNSGALVETYTIQGANAASTQSGTTWTLSSATSAVTADLYALEAQFSTSQPTKNDGDWATDLLVSSASACSSDGAKFGNGTVGQAGYNVSPVAGSNSRNLFFRLHTPYMVSDTTERLAVVTVAVQ